MSAAITIEPIEFLAKLKPGEKLAGCYLLQKRMEGAGERNVWLAHDEVLGKDVALHFLPLAIVKREGVTDRLKSEVKRNRQLINPGIVRALDLIVEDEWAALASEPFEGQTLAALIAKGGKKFREVGEIQPWIQQAGTALEHAHKIRLAHGGLTPDDIVVDEKGKVRVMGFGVSGALREAVRGQKEEAAHAALQFASPQQIEKQPATAADDVFSLGAIAHTLLAGEPPFAAGAKRGPAPTVAEHRKRLKHEGAAVPESWEKTIAGSLSSDASARPASGQVFVDGLRAGGDAPAPVASAAAAVSAPTSAAAPAVSVVEAKAVDVKSAESKAPVTNKAAEAKGPEKAPETKAPEAKPAETKPAETKPVEAKGAESKTAEKKSGAAATPPPIPPAAPSTAKTEAKPEEKTQPKPETKSETKPAPAAEAGKESPKDPGKKDAPAGAATVVEAAAAAVAGAAAAGAVPEAKADEKAKEPAGEKKFADRNPKEAEKTEKVKGGESSRATEKPVEADKARGSQAKEKDRAADERKPATTIRRDERPPAKRSYSYDDEEEYGYDGGGSGQKIGIALVGLAVAVLIIFAIGRLFFNKATTTDLPYSNPTPAPANGANTTPAPNPAQPTPEAVKIAESATPAPVPPKPESEPAPATPKPMPLAESPTPAPAPPAHAPADDPVKAVEEGVKKQKEIETELAMKRKTLDDLNKSLPTLEKGANENSSAMKKREDEATKAEQEARKAEQLAEDKKKAAEEARKTATVLADQIKAKKEEHTKAVEDASRLQKEIQDQDKALAELRKATAELQKKANEGARTQPDATVDDTLKRFREKQAELEKQLNGMTAAPKTPADSKKSGTDGSSKKTGNAAAPEPGATLKLDEPLPEKESLPEMPQLAKADTPKSSDIQPKAKDEGTKEPSSEKSGFGDGYINSIGMRFAAVPGVNGLVAIWPTRVRDFEAFAKSTGLKSTLWKDPGFKQGPDHPVVNVTWQEAMAFCKWLTIREQKEGILPSNQAYRLPTDLEWSRAVGLPDENGSTPERRDMGVPDMYPWGTAWPPPPGSGNYTGEETGSDVAIKGYDDGFAWTSPVGSFPPNKAGLFDMGGNVWQWTMDNWNTESKAKVLRGASWYNGALKLSLLSSCRVHAAPDSGTDNYGFRVVIVQIDGDSSKGKK